VKLLVGLSPALSGQLLLFDGLEVRFRTVRLRGRSPNADKIDQLVDYEEFCGAPATDREAAGGINILRNNKQVQNCYW
jgi:hypothetical protein